MTENNENSRYQAPNENTSKKYATSEYNEFIYSILNEIEYDISKLNLPLINYYNIPYNVVKIIINILDNKIITNNNKSGPISINNDIEEENIEDSMSEDSNSSREEDDIIQPKQINENIDQVIYIKDFVLFDESKMMIKDENENEKDIFQKKIKTEQKKKKNP